MPCLRSLDKEGLLSLKSFTIVDALIIAYMLLEFFIVIVVSVSLEFHVQAEECEARAKSLQQELDALKERTERAAAGGAGSEAAQLALQVTQAESRITG